MNILSKIIIILISVFTFIFLIFITYITNTFSNFEKLYYKEIEFGLSIINQNNDKTFSINKNLKTNSGTLYIEQINISDNIIFSSGSIQTETISGSIVISITPGLYLFNLRELNSKYIIKGLGFEIENKGPGIFFINNISTKKNIIFSMNSLLNLNLKNYKNNEHITSLDLYPHNYIIFNPIKNNFVKNGDLLKISQTFILSYFNKNLKEDNTINEEIIQLISLKNKTYNKYIKNSLLFIEQENNNSLIIIDTFIKSTFGTILGESLINKYFHFFINQNKKSIYYKNIIIRNLHELLISTEVDNGKVNSIVNTIKLIEKIDQKGATEMKNIINYYYSIVFKTNKSNEVKINFSILIRQLQNKQFNFNSNSLILLEQIFIKNNYSKFYDDIALFIEKYFEDLNVDIDGINTKKLTINDIEKIDYLLYFLENIILTSTFSDNNINSIITILNDYVKIANTFYSYSDEKIKRTGLFTNSRILKKIKDILENKYFNEKRNNNKLLEIKKDISISQSEVLLLELNINLILNYYKQNNQYLSEENNKDKFLVRLYSSLTYKYTEYFSALKDYEKYLASYDQSKKDLLSKKTINENIDSNIKLSIDNAKKYLDSFNGVNSQYTKITVKDYAYCLSPTLENDTKLVEIPYCYKVEDLIINYKNISFLLSPFEKNKISEIVLLNKPKAGTYKLDEIKIILDEKIKNESKNKEQYDFKNFLIQTFGKTSNYNNTNNTIIDTKEEIVKEDVVIKLFKRNKLLGNLGDFISLEGFINILYNDLNVEKKGEFYYIYIKDSILSLSLSKDQQFYGYFSSEYNFFPKHSFINPKIKLMDKKSDKQLLIGNSIYIKGEYKINTIKDEFKNIFSNYYSIEKIIKIINTKLKISDIHITYIKSSENITFELIYLGKPLYINYYNGNINKINYNNKVLIQSKIPYKNLDSILNTITN